MIRLSPREQQVLDLYVKEGRLKAVAAALNLSVHTVKTQKEKLMRKLGVSNSMQLFSVAMKRGLVNLEGPRKGKV